jgi:cellulose biosynthesis protein BcsQ
VIKRACQALSSPFAPLTISFSSTPPPGKAMLAFNGLAAADLILIPASAERMAVDGVADLINHVQRILWNKFDLTHQELRILFTTYRSTPNHSPAIVENARKIWRDDILNVKIPHSTIFARSYDEKVPVHKLEPITQDLSLTTY